VEGGNLKYIPYNRLFRLAENVVVKNGSDASMVYEGYANRDSLMYRRLYNLDNISTLLRGTLRKKNFCKAWDVFVQLGLTDDSYAIEDSASLTYADLVKAFLPAAAKGATLRDRLAGWMGVDTGDNIMDMIEWTGVPFRTRIGLEKASPARILQQLLEREMEARHG
jgi:hypothetical protein